jgi:hypothetical protein
MSTAKFVKALARHELAVTGLAAATSAIGSELAKCPIQKELDKHYDLQWQGGGYWQIEQLTDDKGRTKNHLWHALNTGERRRYDDEVTEYLADEETGCPHCARAWELVHERKKARQELGVARRLIRYYGKLALAMVATDE